MKKRNLRSLQLNKKIISNFNILGGRMDSSESLWDDTNCGSEQGCTTGPDESLTSDGQC